MLSNLAFASLLLLNFPLVSLASPVHPLDGSITVDHPTKTGRAIFEREAPSEYPLEPGPFPNEWKYVNWDADDAEQKAQLEKIHLAFLETFNGMAAQAQSRYRDDDQTMIQRWFGVQDDNPNEQEAVFKNMWDWDAGTATHQVSETICDREDFKGYCARSINAYMDPPTGRFHICPRGLDKPLNSEILCTDLDASCSLKMRSLSMSLLHEMTHYEEIGAAARGTMAIVDIEKGRGAHDCFKLDSDAKTDNAQNYAWFAGEAYWSMKCDKTFTDPAPGIQ
jgi:hypothetical protein